MADPTLLIFPRRISFSPGVGYDYTQDPDCQGAWFFNTATDADEYDHSGNNYTAYKYGSGNVSSSTTVPTGYSTDGRSKDFPGSGGYYGVGASAGLNINGADAKLSIVAWIRPDAMSSGEENIIVIKSDNTANQRQYIIEIIGTTTYQVRGGVSISNTDGTGWDLVTSTNSYSVGSGHHIALTLDDEYLRIYVDGSLDCTPEAHTEGVLGASTEVGIGAYLGLAAYSQDGLIDEVAIFSRALSATEIAEIKTYGIDGTKSANDT